MFRIVKRREASLGRDRQRANPIITSIISIIRVFIIARIMCIIIVIRILSCTNICCISALVPIRITYYII